MIITIYVLQERSMEGAVIQRQLFNRMREAQANPRAYRR
jgi:hypothetical protein